MILKILIASSIAWLSISGSAFQLDHFYQTNQTPKDATPELAEAARLTVSVVKLYAERRYDEALPLAKRVLEIREQKLAAGDERIVNAVTNIVEIYIAMKKLGEAEQLLERVLQDYEKKFGPDDLRLSAILDRLAFVHYAKSRFSETAAALSRSLQIKEKAFGPESREVADVLHRLAEFYRNRGKFKEAEPLFDRALMIMRTKVAPDKDATNKLLEHYACTYYESGQREKLEGLKQRYTAEKAPEASSTWVLNGRALELPKPEYSKAARDDRAAGTVVVAVTIDERGNVIEARDMCGSHKALAQSSIEAARRAKFTPTKLSGQPVKVTGIIAYNFVAR